MEKRKKEEDNFNGSWCPLFGRLPNVEQYPASSPIRRCIEIINASRQLWDIDINSSGNLKDSTALPLKNSHEAVNYPQSLIDVAREISNNYDGIYTDAVLYMPKLRGEKVWYKKETGEYEPYHQLDTVTEHAIEVSKHRALGKESDTIEKIPDYAILAILAIEEARFVLHCIKEGESEDDPSVLKSVLIARSLLERASDLEQEETIQRLENDITENSPKIKKLENIENNRKKNLKEATTENIRKANIREKKWRALASKLWNTPGKKSFSIARMAHEIENILLADEDSNEYRASFETIKRKIRDLKPRV
jgi:hypothetical protein